MHSTTHQAERQPWTVLILLCAAQFMVILDITVVNVALPSIGAALGFAPADLQWVVTAYVLCAGGLLLLGGRAADLLGRRRMFLAGLALFTGASLASALAPSPAALVAARAAQGVGAAMLTPAALSIIVTTYSGAQHTTALTVWGAVGSGGAAAGMLVGGMLTTWLSWEWVFLVNVPVGVVAGLLALRMIPATRPARARGRLDLPGALAVVAGLALLIYALEGAPEHGWGSTRTLALLAAAAAALASFAAIERASAHPLVPPRIWTMRPLVGGAALMLGGSGLLVGGFFLNSLYMQDVLGASPLETGLGFLPIAVAIALAAHVAGHALARAGARAVAVAGLTLLAAGAAVLAAAPDQASYAADLLPGFLLLGLGGGLAFPAASVTSMSVADHETAGLASGVMMTAHETGGALGVATLSAIAAGTAGTFGYGDGFLAAAVIAGALALVALLAVPAVRPAAGAHVGVH